MNTSNDGYLKVLKHQDFNTHIEQDSKSLELAINKFKKGGVAQNPLSK